MHTYIINTHTKCTCLYLILLTEFVDNGLAVPVKKGKTHFFNGNCIHFCLCHYNYVNTIFGDCDMHAFV